MNSVSRGGEVARATWWVSCRRYVINMLFTGSTSVKWCERKCSTPKGRLSMGTTVVLQMVYVVAMPYGLVESCMESMKTLTVELACAVQNLSVCANMLKAIWNWCWWLMESSYLVWRNKAISFGPMITFTSKQCKNALSGWGGENVRNVRNPWRDGERHCTMVHCLVEPSE